MTAPTLPSRYLACCDGVMFADCDELDWAFGAVARHLPDCPTETMLRDPTRLRWDQIDGAAGHTTWLATLDGAPTGHTVRQQPTADVPASTGGLNPMWDEVVAWARLNPLGQQVLGWRYQAMHLPYPAEADVPANMFIDHLHMRAKMCARYAYTITAPDTVAFVAKACGKAAVDPLAGSGYWGHLLTTHGGVDVLSADLDPPLGTHTPVRTGHAPDTVRAAHGSGRTLLLAWPPWADPVGADILDAYDGNRVVYLGDLGSGDLGGVCGDANLRMLLKHRWRQVAQHHPPRWYGHEDVVAVFERDGAR